MNAQGFNAQGLKVALMVGLSTACLSVQLTQLTLAHGQSLSTFDVVTTPQTASGLARVYNSSVGGTLPNGFVAISLPTQVMVNGGVQILTPEYRVLTLAPGTYEVQGTQVYAQPAALRAIGYPADLLPLQTIAPTAVGAAPTTTRITGRKVLGFVPSAGTTFNAGNADPTYGTQGLRVTEYACQTTSPTTLASLSGDVAFDSNKATLKAGARAELDNLAQQMLGRSGARFTITGHTDSRGSDSYNQALSESRAKAVKDYLATQGVAAASITAVGAGEGSPIASNDTTAGQAANRRVEITSTGGTATTAQTCTRTQVAPLAPNQTPTSTFVQQPSFAPTASIPVVPPTFGQQPFAQPTFEAPTFAPTSFDTTSTFIEGSQSLGGQPAAVVLGPSTGQDFAVASQPEFNAGFVDSGQDFAEINAAAEDQGIFGGLTQSVQDTPWYVWAGGAAAAAAVGYLVFSGGDSD